VPVSRLPHGNQPAALGYLGYTTYPATASLETSVLPRRAVRNICPSGCTDSFNKVLKQDLLVSLDLTACKQSSPMLIYSVMTDKNLFYWYAPSWTIREAGVLYQEHDIFFKVRINMKD